MSGSISGPRNTRAHVQGSCGILLDAEDAIMSKGTVVASSVE